MSQKSLFEFSTYKSAMRHRLRPKETRGALSRAAEALKCQRSYLSRVMNSELHLTPDQAYLLCQYWLVQAAEREYFQTLVEYERAADRGYRDHLQTRLRELRLAHESLSERMQRPQPSTVGVREAIYFSSWHWSAIHFLTSVPQYQSASAISLRMALPVEGVQTCLEQLQSWGLVRESAGRWEYIAGEFHLPKNSPFVVQHHQNWRARAVLDSQFTRTSNQLHYTNIQTAAKADLPVVYELTLKYVSDLKAILGPSRPEEAIAITCDLWTI